jgi:hypothetical protein
MMLKRWLFLGLSLLMLAPTGCALGVVQSVTAPAATVAPTAAPTYTPAASAVTITPIAAVTVTAPNGASLIRYAFAGTGTTLTVDNKRVDWTGERRADGTESVLVGDITLGDEGWEITQAILAPADGGWKIQSSNVVLVQGIELADGSSCWFAGRGATFGFQDQRANFTCGDRKAQEITALFGELKPGDNGYEILRATGSLGEQGFTATSSAQMTVVALYVGPMP